MTVRHMGLLGMGALAGAILIAWFVAVRGPAATSVQIQEVGDPAWRVEVQEVKPAGELSAGAEPLAAETAR